jgi:3-oxoacyl-[acyl-carrier protein] reductase
MSNKNVIVTGGARDIGKAICLKFAQQGFNVIINYFHSEAKALETLKEVESLGVKVRAVRADLTTEQGVEKLLGEVITVFDSIDVLVNNTGGMVERRNLKEMDGDFFDEVLKLNFKSTFLTSSAFLPQMKSGSSVVNVSSQAARDGGGGGSALYAASKAAVSSFTKSMAKEFGPKGIRVNAVCPGMIDTLFHDTFTADEIRANFEATVPVRRQGVPMDVAELVYFLASDQASFITGANYDINGGAVLS